MIEQSRAISRRHFLGATGAAVATTLSAGKWSLAAPAAARPKVAAVFTEFTYRSHAHVLLENFLEKYYFNGKLTDPGVDVVAFYADQMPEGDMSKDVSAKYGIPIFKTIAEAVASAARSSLSTACCRSASTALIRTTSSSSTCIRASGSSTKSSP